MDFTMHIQHNARWINVGNAYRIFNFTMIYALDVKRKIFNSFCKQFASIKHKPFHLKHKPFQEMKIKWNNSMKKETKEKKEGKKSDGMFCGQIQFENKMKPLSP